MTFAREDKPPYCNQCGIPHTGPCLREGQEDVAVPVGEYPELPKSMDREK